MIYYKNVLLSLSNGLNSLRVSQQANPYQNQDAQLLGQACKSLVQVYARNGREYYYFCDCEISPEIVQFLLNQNGVLAYRRYSKYQKYYMGDHRYLVRVPVSYVASHPAAEKFINKVKYVQENANYNHPINIAEALVAVLARMKQK